MKRKSFVAVACAAAMIASMTSGLTVFAEESADFSGEEQAGWITDMMQQSSVLKILMV